ncbi:RNA polymerase sigma-70 factor [Chitinophaga sp.]|uniref:RNA polymerase sigma-70 factor n=1 Tax=Chitinophaga sp. TaxID=1869181 RepID=UPI0031DDDE81
MENELFIQITQGSEAAFETVFRTHFKSMCFYAGLLGLRPEEAAEVTQLTFMRFWERRLELRAEGRLDAYLYTALRNNCLDQLRRQKKRGVMEAVPEDALSANPDWLAYKELEQRFREVLDSLPHQMKQVFTLSRLEGMKYKEISAALNISVKTVETQMTRALKRLRTDLKDYMPFLLFLFLQE